MSEDPLTRALALTRSAEAGAAVVRIPVNWRFEVDASPPSNFDDRDPSSAGYHFATLDAAVRDAVASGMRPLLVVSHAPEFAEAPGRWPYAYRGSWDPSPMALANFAYAIATRYNGAFPDPELLGNVLPRVSAFQAWNEPNLPRYLEPQWISVRGHWSPFSPLIYRQMLNAFYDGVKSAEPRDEVVAAGIAPVGDRMGSGRMAPVSFLRTLLCLTPTLRREANCSDPVHFDAFAFHPLSVASPNSSAPSVVDVSIADAGKLSTILTLADRSHAVLPAGRKPLWVTELNWESEPPSRYGVPSRLQAGWVSRGLHRLWVAGVTLVDWQFLADPYPRLHLALPTGGTISLSRPAGLYEAYSADQLADRPKPFLEGFTTPFDPIRVGRRRVRVWALLRRPGDTAFVQRRRGRRWVTVARLASGLGGIVNNVINLKGSTLLRLVSGARLSAAASVGRRRAFVSSAVSASGSPQSSVRAR